MWAVCRHSDKRLHCTNIHPTIEQMRCEADGNFYCSHAARDFA
jgi:hypothetical protein